MQSRLDANLLVATSKSAESLVSVVDVRVANGKSKSGAVWKLSGAHNGPVTSCKFNPFVPYWCASAGEDGVVKLWDLVYALFRCLIHALYRCLIHALFRCLIHALLYPPRAL